MSVTIREYNVRYVTNKYSVIQHKSRDLIKPFSIGWIFSSLFVSSLVLRWLPTSADCPPLGGRWTGFSLLPVFCNSLCVTCLVPPWTGPLHGLWPVSRYSTESYLVVWRCVNSRIVPGTLSKSTLILSILDLDRLLKLFWGSVGERLKDVGKNLCYISYVEIYIL